MKIETKFSIGDKVLYNNRIYTVECIHLRSNKNIRYTLRGYTLLHSVEESRLSKAPRYSVGEKVWIMYEYDIYHCIVKSNHSNIVTALHKDRWFIYDESIFYTTKEALLAAIPCHELPAYETPTMAKV